MIPREAFAAITAVMVVGWAFGVVCDRMLIHWAKTHKKPNKAAERRSCDNCKYEYTNPHDSPCKECADDDIDMWTPADGCSSCRHKNKSWYDEPCDICTGDMWEAER